MATRMTHRAPGRNATLSALAVAVLLSGGIFTIPAGNARAAEATCPAAPPALSKFKPQTAKTGPVETPFTTADGKTVLYDSSKDGEEERTFLLSMSAL